MNVPERYTSVATALHWLLAALLFGQIAFGWFLHDVPRETPERAIYVNLHKSIGMTLGLIIMFRLYWRVTHPAPALPLSLPSWERVMARASHAALYACMVVMPVTGYVASNFSKWGVNFYNAVKLPPWGVDDERIYATFNGAHVITSYVFVTLIVLHVLAALRHLVLRDGVFSRMWPVRRHPD